MSSTSFPTRLSLRIALCAAQLLGLGLVLALLAPSLSLAQPASVPDAPGVSPAPIVDKPLQPAVAQEVPEEQPSPQHAWVPGHWRWQEGAYVWVSAHWELPPVPNASWVQPHWEAKGKGFVLVEGFWQDAAPPASAAQPAPAPDNTVVVEVPPPPPNREIIVERPSPAHVWISGFWGWRAGRHVWIGGHWELPPREHAVWVEPRWERRDNGYVLIDGFWRDVGVSIGIGAPPPREVVVERPSREVIVVREPPPPPRHEVIVPRPSPRHVLIEGYWAWQGGRQVWIASHWELPPRGHSVWVAPRWDRRGDGFVFVEGYWR
jgi:hypothetical protein